MLISLFRKTIGSPGNCISHNMHLSCLANNFVINTSKTSPQIPITPPGCRLIKKFPTVFHTFPVHTHFQQLNWADVPVCASSRKMLFFFLVTFVNRKTVSIIEARCARTMSRGGCVESTLRLHRKPLDSMEILIQ